MDHGNAVDWYVVVKPCLEKKAKIPSLIDWFLPWTESQFFNNNFAHEFFNNIWRFIDYMKI